LPALPKEEENKIFKQTSIFKRLKSKAKIKVHYLKKLIKREKFRNQEMVTKIEISVNK